MKITITTTEKEAKLIQRALDLYTRVGMCQLQYLTDCYSLEKMLERKGVDENEFRDKLADAKKLLGLSRNGSYGIFSSEVGDDAKTACHIHDQIRHELWKAQEDRPQYVSSAHPANICQIA